MQHPTHRRGVLGYGQALRDTLAFVDADAPRRFGLTPGRAHQMDRPAFDALYARITPDLQIAGGSIANTLAGLRVLGVPVALAAVFGDDAAGHQVARETQAAGIVPVLPQQPGNTGEILVLVTPDGERTMAATPDSSYDLRPEMLSDDLLTSHAVLLIEGYLLNDADCAAGALTAMQRAHALGTPTALTPGCASIALDYPERVAALLETGPDVVFANADEASAMTGETSPAAAAQALARRAGTAFVTLGADGALTCTAGRLYAAKACTPARLKDTTGAGDAFAAGALAALLRGESPARAADLGGCCAAEVVARAGPRMKPPRDRRTTAAVLATS